MSRVYPQSQFTPLTQADLQRVWQWRNQANIRQNMHNTREISWQEHQTWFEHLPQSGKTFYLFRQNSRPIGALYFQPYGDNGLEWGCYLGETDVWPGSGLLLEIAALDFAAAQPCITHLHAEVLSFNYSVLKMHQLFGYQVCPDKATNAPAHAPPCCIKVFAYQTADWRAERATILARLPRQIAAAANYIHFQD